MLGSKQEKEMTRSEAIKKIEAYKTLNSVLVKTNAEFMNSLTSKLTETQVQHDQLKEKLDKGEGTDEENARYIFLGGYLQCLKDIVGAKRN